MIVSGVSPRDARQRASEGVWRQWSCGTGASPAFAVERGQRQRVTIARSLVNQPEIVWADEPTGALDSKTADDIMTLMETLNRDQGLTFVIVTHDPGVGARCDRIVQMRDGLIVDEEVLR